MYSICEYFSESSLKMIFFFFSYYVTECGVSKHYRQRRPRLEEQKAESNKSSRMIDFDEDDRVLKGRHKARIINGKESKPGAFPWQVNTLLIFFY